MSTKKPDTHGNIIGKDFKHLVPDSSGTNYTRKTLQDIGNAMISQAGTRTQTGIPAGYTYLGQFIDHDMTFTNGEDNDRTAQLDLDSVYPAEGEGEKNNTMQDKKFLFNSVDSASDVRDLLRDKISHAKIPDSRNDENIIIASLHLTFQKFHNILINEKGKSFDEAKRIVLDHYHAIVAYDFLPKVTDMNAREVQNILNGNDKRFLYTKKSVQDNGNKPFIPTEFSGACYRFGHSMVQDRYDFNNTFKNEPTLNNLFFNFNRAPDANSDPASHTITKDWTLTGKGKGDVHESLNIFFGQINDNEVGGINFTSKIDPLLSEVMGKIPVKGDASANLPAMNLLRGQMLNLASGQEFARWVKKSASSGHKMKAAPLLENSAIAIFIRQELKIQNIDIIKVSKKTPLWFYILCEANVNAQGNTLGPMGSRLVAEVILGILMDDMVNVDSISREGVLWESDIIFDDQNNGKKASEMTMLDIITFVDENHDNIL